MTRLEKFLLQITIFLIPANLSLHYYHSLAYINGRLVDYLLPKFYISDIPLIILLVIFIFKSLKSLDVLSILTIPKYIMGLLLLIYLAARSLVSNNPVSSFWYVLKIIEFTLFGIYIIRNYTFHSLLRTINLPILVSILFQSIIVIYQYIYHIPLFGYYLLGQSNLDSINVVKDVYRGYLEVVPYGTTPHPNVLAGFISLASLFLYVCSTLYLSKYLKKAVLLSLIGLNIAILLITNSINALSGLTSTIIIYNIVKMVSNRKRSLLLLTWVIISQIFILLLFNIIHQAEFLFDNPSFTNRYELNQASIKIILNNPLSGVGPNLNSANISSYPLPGQQAYFMQPVHHGFLLIMSEIGFTGFSLVIINLIIWLNSSRALKASNLAYLPFVAISCLLLLDHYPLTLQTGQLIFTLSIILPLLKSSSLE